MLDTASKIAKEDEADEGDQSRAIFGAHTREELIKNLNDLNGADGEDTKIIEEDQYEGGNIKA